MKREVCPQHLKVETHKLIKDLQPRESSRSKTSNAKGVHLTEDDVQPYSTILLIAN